MNDSTPLGAVLAGFGLGIVLALLARLAGWSIRHPMFVGFVAVSTVAAMAGPFWLAGWLVLAALVAAGLGVQHTPSTGGDAAVFALTSVCLAVWWMLRHPVAVAATAGSVWLAWVAGPLWLVVAWCAVAVAAGVWQWLAPAGFERWVGVRARSAWRSVSVYSWRWGRVMRASGLALSIDGAVVVPRKLKLRSGPWADRVRAELVTAQCVEDWEKAAPALAASFGTLDCRVRRRDPYRHEVELVFRHRDALAGSITPPVRRTDGVDLSALEVGRLDTGEPWSLRVTQTHVLVAGESGAGKGSVVGSVIDAVAPLVANGEVELWGCDPKGGVELALYGPMFCHLAWEPSEMVELLEQAAGEMQARVGRLRGHGRQSVRSASEPHRLLFVDEFAFLTAYQPDRDLRERAEAALAILLSQGRAANTTVVGALQDPRKEVLRNRDLFGTRVALRLADPTITDLVLGDGAHRRGALCDQVPASLPGVGYVVLDGQSEPERCRAFWVSDEHIGWLAETYPAPAGARIINATGRFTNPQPEPATTASAESSVGFDDDDRDDLGAWDAA